MKRKLPSFVLAIASLFAFQFFQLSAKAQVSFREVTTSGLPVDGLTSLTSVDFDSDGLIDVSGTAVNEETVMFYRNQGGNVFAAFGQPVPIMSPFRNVFWADENGDGLMDFLVTRTNNAGAPSPRIFLQNADHSFTEKDFGFEGEAIGWCDFDNDGRFDVLINVTTPTRTGVYWKQPDGTYTRVILVPGRFSFAADLDADGDLDLVALASTTFKGPVFKKIFRNDGSGHFTDTDVIGSFFGAADFNNDGLLDLAGSRATSASAFTGSGMETDIYYNEGGFVFRTNAVPGISIYHQVMSVGDYDGDGLADLLCFTTPTASGVTPNLMVNTNGGFVTSGKAFSNSAYDVNSIEAADFDGDGDLDFITSPRGLGVPLRLIRNDLNATRIVSAPANLASLVRRDRVDFSWQGTDTRATSFNFRVGTTPGASDVVSPESLPDGRRMVSRMGNAGTVRAWHLLNLKPGTYYWSVQAVDWGYRGSPFAAEQSFTVADPGPLPELPTISGLQNAVTDEDTPLNIPFSISPASAAANIEVFAESSNATLIPNLGLKVIGTGEQGILRIEPALNRSGLATITVWVKDLFGQTRATAFDLQVFPVNDAPVISEIPDQFVYAGGPDLLLSFTVSDAETPLSSTSPFKVSATSSDTNVIPNANLTVAADSLQFPLPVDGFNFTLRVRLTTNRVGSTTITLTTTDGQALAARSFVLVIAPPAFKDMGVRFGSQTAGGLGPLLTADFNNDGRMDVLVGNGAGLSMFQGASGGYTAQPFVFKTGVAVLAQDFNNDNFVDVFVIAADQTTLYLSDKGTNFTATRIPNITTLYTGRVEAVDLDNDGDLDLFVVGFAAIDSTTQVTAEYLNDGATWRSIPLTAVPTSTASFTLTDFDGDGQVDLVGEARAGNVTANGVFRGIGGGRFEYQPGSDILVPTAFRGLADFDSDGILEFWTTESGPFVRAQPTEWWIKIFNRPDGVPELAARLDGPPNTTLSRVFGDFDNDGLIDLLFTPITPAPVLNAGRFQLWQNAGGFEFRSLGAPLLMLTNGSVAVADMNGDGSLDVIGQPTNRIGLMIMTNTVTTIKAQPGVPRNLRAERVGDALRFSWDRPSDLKQDAAFTYNVRIGSSPGGVDVLPPLSLANGRRLVVGQGNAGNRLSLVLTNLTKERYYWSVQAVDNRSVGGVFAPELEIGFALPDKTPAHVTFNPAAYVGGEDMTGLMTLTIVDDNTPVGEIRLRVFTENPEFLSFTNLTVTGTGAVRTLTIKPPPNRSGETRLVVHVIDASGPVSTNITTLTITNVNDLPTISSIGDQFSDGPGDPVTAFFTIGDIDDALDTLKLTAISGNEQILPSDSVVFAGSGANRSVTLQTTSTTPGIFPVTVQVTDPGGASRQTTFQMAFTNRVFKQLDAVFPGVTAGKMIWGDVDNDGDLDVLIAGQGLGPTALYFNQGGGVFLPGNTFFPGNSLGGVDWGDFDNDGNLDLIVQGFDNERFVTELYRGDGRGNLTPMNLGLSGLYGVPQFGDFDNDGLLDFLITGTTNIVPTSVLYMNRKTNFSAQAASIIGGFYGWREMFEDFNADGRLDIRMRGLSNNVGIDQLFLQTSAGALEPQASPTWTGWLMAWADFDNDGLPDALVSTAPPGSPGSLVLQKNLGNVLDTPGTVVVPSVLVGSAAVGDYDSDGFIDFVMTGNQYGVGSTPRLFHNEGAGKFAEVMTTLPFLSYSGASWADADGDGYLDLMVSGSNAFGEEVTLLFKNHLVKPLAFLIAPRGLRARQTDDGLWIEWDANAGRPGLTYNVAVGSAPGKWDVLSPMSATNGWRKVAAKGNAGWKTAKLIRGLEVGKTYYYSVQAVDNTFRGSPFAAEQSVEIEILPQLQVTTDSAGAIIGTLTGAPNREYIIETSTDLKTWSELATLQDANGTMHTNFPATEFPGALFLRARSK